MFTRTKELIMSSIGILESKGFGSNQRFLLFMLVCIPLRLSFSFVSYKLRESPLFGLLLLILGLVSVGLNLQKMRGNPWWSRKVHLASSVLLVLTVLVSKLKPSVLLNQLPSTILLLDVLYGLGSSLIIRPFGTK